MDRGAWTLPWKEEKGKACYVESSSQMAKMGGELVGGELGVVLEETGVGVTFVDSPSLASAGLTEDPLNSDLTVCQYILPNDVAVAGFEEVAEEVELGSPSWENLNKTSSSSSSSLSQDSGIGTDPSPDVFFTLIEETVAPSGLLTSSPNQEGGEVIVERIYEMKDDLCFTENTPEIKDEPLETVEEAVELEGEEHVIEQEDLYPKRIKGEVISEHTSGTEARKSTRVRVVAYHCTDCNINFTDEAEFRAHMEAHLIKLQNSCALCSTEFSTKSELQVHIKEHFAKSSSYTCNICDQKFVSKSGLKRHKKQLHNLDTVVVVNASSIKCGVCQAVFSDKAALKQHAATHATRKPFTCEECGATFTQNGSLQVHLRRHRGEKPFTCQLCGNSFTRAHSLKVHMKTHTGEKPYACEYCGACFVTSSHLTVHRRTHTGERPYSCGDCGATFITTSHLNVHRRVHAGGGTLASTPVSCSQCQAVFTDAAQLRHHRRTQHAPQVTCKVCCKEFPNARQLNNHMVHECG